MQRTFSDPFRIRLNAMSEEKRVADAVILRIASNMSFPETRQLGNVLCEIFRARSLRELVGQLRCTDFVVLDGNEMVLRYCLLSFILPVFRRPFVALDLVLRKPQTAGEFVKARIIRVLLHRVDFFIHYFKDLSGYERYFGIGAERSGYVPFKPNLSRRGTLNSQQEGEYILCFGQSMRDYETFFEAVKALPYPCAVPKPKYERLRQHGSRFIRKLSELPSNVRLLDDDGSEEAMIGILKEAKLVVLPILKTSLCASGIGVYLNSMYLGKCVIMSATPGAADVLSNQALIVPPEDPIALREKIRVAWTDDLLREKTASAGRAYASGLGGVRELCDRVLHESLRWYFRQQFQERNVF